MARLSREYVRYMHSPEWRARRLIKLAEVGHKCQRCGEVNHLQVHHKHYRTFKNETNEDLEVVCKPCHRMDHPHLSDPTKFKVRKKRKLRYLSAEDRETKLAIRREKRAQRRANLISPNSQQ